MKVLLTATLLFSFAFAIQAESLPLWIGTGGNNARGIYQTNLDTEKGSLSEPTLAVEVDGPGFLTLNAKGDRLYAVCKIGEPCVAAYSIGDDKTLTLINSQPIGDGGAAHISIDQTDSILFTAQYGGGSTASFPVNEDGSIGPRASLIEHSGSGPDKARQTAPHPHFTGISPDNRFLFVPDLGTDKVIIYRINHDDSTIEPHGFGQGVPGGGPRHMKFNPDGSRIYLLNEMHLSVTVFEYDAKKGTMVATQTIENLPEEAKEIPNKASDIHVHPSGKFVYAANRGHDSITAFSVDKVSGELTLIEREAIRGSWPRNFNIDPSGKWLIAAGRYSNTLSVFEIDPQSGGLSFSSNIVNCPSPICVGYAAPQ
tara:strand:+ start:1119 stop:2225 length:1107 start_codon:yes stop_codon:yes gene_type:complete